MTSVKEKIIWLRIKTIYTAVKNVAQHLIIKWSGNSITARSIPAIPVKTARSTSIGKGSLKRITSRCIPSYKNSSANTFRLETWAYSLSHLLLKLFCFHH